ncbi:MAG: Lrp/AsnC family transcriptional regulator [Pseudomonadota bacterium]
MIDSTDSRILSALQKNGQLTSQELGDMLNLSASQASRRRARLESSGYIRTYRAQLDTEKLGLTIQAFVQVDMATHRPELVKGFTRLLETQAEITSVWVLTGNADYLLRVYCEDLPSLNRLIHEVLLPHKAVAKVQSQIVMDQCKADAPLPV